MITRGIPQALYTQTCMMHKAEMLQEHEILWAGP